MVPSPHRATIHPQHEQDFFASSVSSYKSKHSSTKLCRPPSISGIKLRRVDVDPRIAPPTTTVTCARYDHVSRCQSTEWSACRMQSHTDGSSCSHRKYSVTVGPAAGKLLEGDLRSWLVIAGSTNATLAEYFSAVARFDMLHTSPSMTREIETQRSGRKPHVLTCRASRRPRQ